MDPEMGSMETRANCMSKGQDPRRLIGVPESSYFHISSCPEVLVSHGC